MTLLDLYKKVKRISGYFNSADIPLKYNGKDFNIDFEFESKDAIVSHIEVKQDPVLTWEDVKKIEDLCMEVTTLFAVTGRNKVILEPPFYEEVARRFNEQKKK